MQLLSFETVVTFRQPLFGARIHFFIQYEHYIVKHQYEHYIVKHIEISSQLYFLVISIMKYRQ